MKKQTSFQRTIGLIVIGIGLIALGVAAMTLITLRQAQSERTDSASVIPVAANYPAPELSLNDLDGNPRSLADYRGQVALVNLWATWCPPCVKELPTLNDFYRDYAANGFILVGVNDGEELPVVKDYVTRTGLTFPIWLDPSFLTESAFGTMNLPSSYVIDRQGQVRLQWIGAISRAMLEKYVVPIIEE
jgi:thiol-disulfide isomerase/thioredoxin